MVFALHCSIPHRLVDPEWVQERIGKVRILDATLHLDPKREALREFKEVGPVKR